MPSFPAVEKLLSKVGKHKASKGCLYINKLTDVNLEVVEEIIKTSFLEMKKANNVL